MSNFYVIKNTPGGKTSAGVPYSEFSNGEFAYRMWEKQKEDAETPEDAMPLGVWADSVGLSNEDFNAAFEIAMGDKFDPLNRNIPNEWTPSLDDKARLVFQGQTFGWGDEIQGAMGALSDIVSGKAGEESFADLYSKYRDSERERIKEFRTNQPMTALKYELGGAVVSPAGIFKAPKIIKQMKTGKQAMAASGSVGAVYGAGTSTEESLGGVAVDSITTGVASSIFGLGLEKTIPLVGKGAEKLKNLFKKNKENPSITKLRELKNTAYENVKTSYGLFNNKDFSEMFSKANQIAIEGHHTAIKDKGVTAALNVFKSLKAGNKEYTLMQMDNVKLVLYTLYNKHPEQKMILEMMDLVDDTIKAKGSQFPELEAARVANSLYKKAEKLDQAFQAVKRTKSAFSKMSDVDLYKNAVLNILNNPKSMKYFSNAEQKIMEQFIKGGIIERTIQRTAELSPNSNRLLTMLAFAGSYFHPAFLIPTATGFVARRIADPAMRNKADELVNTIGKLPSKKVTPGMSQAGGVSGAVLGADQ